ncbi:MAG: hypothetical protein Q7R52_04365, partial [archaeon]|nr:hypothetical protein [archaeon]
LSACWWSNNSGTSNVSLANCGTNITGYQWNEGVVNISIWANDTLNNVNSTSVRFVVDTIQPAITITSPLNNTNTSNNQIGINYTATDSGIGLSACWWSNNSGTSNVSLANCGTNITGYQWNEGVVNISIWANDTLNNINSTSVRFVVDSVSPLISLTSPASGYSSTTTTTTFNYNTNDSNSVNCSLILNGNAVNFNSTVNITGGTNVFINSTVVGSYNWNINCTDEFNNYANASSRAFTITAVPVILPVGGGSSTGGGGGSTTEEVKFDLSKNNYETTVALNHTEYSQFSITNKDSIIRSFSITTSNLDNIILLEKALATIDKGKSEEIKFTVIAPEKPGIYAGKIIVSAGSTTKEILVVVNVKSEKSLFDVTLTLPKEMKMIEQGGKINSQINLLQAGLREKMDVTLNYIIKDYNGKVYLAESETVQVYDQKTLNKEFHTENLPLGDYVLAVELIYPGGVAVVSSQFKVAEKLDVNHLTPLQIIIIGLIVIVILAFVLMAMLIQRYKKPKKYLIKRKARGKK